MAAVGLVVTAGLFALSRRVAPVERSPAYRFVDPAQRGESDIEANGRIMRTEGFPAASLTDDVRFVLRSPARAPIFYTERIDVPENATVLLLPPLPPELKGAHRLALVPQVKTASGWYKLPTGVTTVQDDAGRPLVPISLTLPEETVGTQVGLHIEALVIDDAHVSTYRTPAVEIPADAVLGFATGIYRPAWEQGAVNFRVKACRGEVCEAIWTRRLDPLTPEGRGWHDFEVSLATFEGASTSFLFETEVASSQTDAFSFPFWANPTVYAPSPPAESHAEVNVILLSIDTLSAKHLDLYGYEHHTAPFIRDFFGRQGTVFDRCVAAATTTPQSHMSMFTGVQPCVHGVITGVEKVTTRLVTLAEVLRSAGYETGAVTEDGWLGYEHGFGRGFNSYAENKSPDIMAPQGQVDVTLAKARQWLEVNGNKPFFLFLHTFQVHDPYSPAPAYTDLFRQRGGITVNADSPRELRESVAYDQEIRYTDDELKEFIDFLRQRGLLEKTVFILTSDHGEEFFEHGLWGHGADFFEEVTRVPLMMTGPGIAQGTRNDATVGHIDLMPTILALTGVSKPQQAGGADVLAAAPAKPAVRFCESRVDLAIGPGYELQRVTPPSFMVQRGTDKLSRYKRDPRFDYQYYDLATDPAEKENGFAANNPPSVALKAMVDAYEVNCAMTLAGLGDEAPSKPMALDPANEDKLRALGYLK